MQCSRKNKLICNADSCLQHSATGGELNSGAGRTVQQVSGELFRKAILQVKIIILETDF